MLKHDALLLRLAIIGCCFLGVISYSQAEPEFATDALYVSLGRQSGIAQIVDDFLAEVIKDARINALFKDTNMKRLTQMLNEQFCEISGGPCRYSGDPMKPIHEKMGITDAQFNAMVEDLQLALDRHHIAPSAQNKLIGRLAPMHADIVLPK